MRKLYTLAALFLLAAPLFAQTDLIALRPFIAANTSVHPIEMLQMPDSSWLVGYQPGVIRRFPANGSGAGVIVLNIAAKVLSSGSEEGLLGMALHPNFSTNQYIYLNYSAASPRRNVIARFTFGTGANAVISPQSELFIIGFNQPFPNHNGGRVEFGLDRMLYIASGDGGSGNDPQRNGQNKNTLLGKVLRINVDATMGIQNYVIPTDNPFASIAGVRGEIWAYGLRNPWKIAQDKITGTWWAGDVGQNLLEEIDTLTKGGNFGWRIKEGSNCTGLETNCQDTTLIAPVFVYNRAAGDVSITGGFVYRGASIPYLYGMYIYADFATGRIWALRLRPGLAAENVLLMNSTSNVSSFGQGTNGEQYVIDHTTGAIYSMEISLTGVKKLSNDMVRVYPNPLSNVIKFEIASPEKAVISVLNLEGKKIGQAQPGGNTDRTYQFDASFLQTGTYLYEAQIGNTISKGRFVIAR